MSHISRRHEARSAATASEARPTVVLPNGKHQPESDAVSALVDHPAGLPSDIDDLVARARQNDPDAWELLYRHVYPGLRGFAARRVGTDHADDVVSETMARAVAGLARYEPGRSFNAWLYGIA